MFSAWFLRCQSFCVNLLFFHAATLKGLQLTLASCLRLAVRGFAVAVRNAFPVLAWPRGSHSIDLGPSNLTWFGDRVPTTVSRGVVSTTSWASWARVPKPKPEPLGLGRIWRWKAGMACHSKRDSKQRNTLRFKSNGWVHVALAKEKTEFQNGLPDRQGETWVPKPAEPAPPIV